MNLPVNSLLQGGKYRIVRFINSGGFGCTYEAEHVMLGKRVAIKEFFVKDFCNRDNATGHVTVGTVGKKGLVAKLKKKFIDEARALCSMQHPGIVKVSDVFEENGTAYFVMDYIVGGSLQDILNWRGGALPEAQALDYIRQAADALQYVHGHNRLHLDLKPGNIMVDCNGRVVLIDFGASKQYDECDGENTSTLLGMTPGYAPIEQMGNDVVKFMPATDIYALGATLYKLLTGITPPSATLLASGETLAPLPATVGASTRKAVMAAMTLNKSKRPQSVREFLSILGSAGTRQGQEEETIVVDYASGSKDEEAHKQEEGSDAEKSKQKKRILAIVGNIAAVALLFWGCKYMDFLIYYGYDGVIAALPNFVIVYFLSLWQINRPAECKKRYANMINIAVMIFAVFVYLNLVVFLLWYLLVLCSFGSIFTLKKGILRKRTLLVACVLYAVVGILWYCVS